MSELRRDDLQNGYFLWQDPSMFCFGIDAVLLSHYPEIKDGDSVADLGTGFAPIPHMMHADARRRGIRIRITGIEIQERAALLAERSVRENGLDGDIRIIHGDLKEAVSLCGAASFSLVVSNPPYVKRGSGLVGKDEAKAAARSELFCTFEDVASQAAALLRPKGRFAMIHRPGRLPELFGVLRQCRLEPKRMRLVCPYADADASMVLLEAVKGGRPGLKAEPPLIVYHRDQTYTEEVLRIYGGNTVSHRDADRKS